MKIKEQEETIEVKQNPHWVALIYYPNREHKTSDVYSSELYQSKKNIPVHPYEIQLPPSGGQKGLPASFDNWIELRPGANLNVQSEHWNVAKELPNTKERFLDGVIEVVEAKTLDNSTPGYRHFGDQEAISLARKTESTDSINEWLKGETRAIVIEEANTKKIRIQEELEKRIN